MDEIFQEISELAMKELLPDDFPAPVIPKSLQMNLKVLEFLKFPGNGNTPSLELSTRWVKSRLE